MKLGTKNKMDCGAVIVAAGSATRMGGIDKMLAMLGGMPVLLRTALALNACPSVRELVIVTRADQAETVAKLCHDGGVDKLKMVAIGGKTRTESVKAGLDQLSDQCRFAAIHDGARPLVTPELAEQVIVTARRTYAAAPAIPVKDTIKIAREGKIIATPDRSTLFAVQTPQVFDLDLLSAALQNADGKALKLTDECAAVEALGKVVYLTQGSEENLKITTPLDLALAEAILHGRQPT
jgi:2-C-methyl-D-erythritol 4-phosphate cytidylyltransferase